MNSMSAICACCCCCCCQCVLHNIMLLLGYLDFGLHLGQIMFSIAKLETGFTLACHYVNLCLSLAKRNRSIIFKCIHPCIQLLSSFKQQQQMCKTNQILPHKSRVGCTVRVQRISLQRLLAVWQHRPCKVGCACNGPLRF